MGCVSSKKSKSRDIIGINPSKKICPTCKQQYTQRGWCQPCEIKRFKDNFHNWTSGNNELDQFIRNTQINTTGPLMFLEWIPYDKFEKIKEIGKGGFGVVYKATWDLGPKMYWDDNRKTWIREGEKNIALKRIFDSNNADSHFWKELCQHRCHHNKYIPRCYGFSRDPVTRDYVIVLELVEEDLRHYLEKNNRNITWEKKLGVIYNIANGLMTIHNARLIHRNLHSGNILRHFNGSQNLTYITDLGQYRPASKQIKDAIDDVSVYGVLPYIAPEVLYGEEYTQASDIYSFGMIMWEVSTGKRPFYERSHDVQLAEDICKGLRPSIITEVPECYTELMEKCWNAEPRLRPNIRELEKTLMSWGWHMGVSQKHDIENQFVSAENERLRFLELTNDNEEEEEEEISFNGSTTCHPGAIYKSRLFKFPDLPKPQNLNEYDDIYSHKGEEKGDIKGGEGYDNDITQINAEKIYYGEEEIKTIATNLLTDNKGFSTSFSIQQYFQSNKNNEVSLLNQNIQDVY